MDYRGFCSVIKAQVGRIDVKDRAVESFLRTAYDTMPKDLTPDQRRTYAESWASEYQSGRLSANMRSRPLLTGLARKAAS